MNAEEELKRRNNMQGMTIRPSGPFHIDTTNDSGSLTRQVTPRLGSDANLGGEMEGGEPDDISNHNMHSRHLLRMSSTSPSSDSPLRRPYIQHNAVSSFSIISLRCQNMLQLILDIFTSLLISISYLPNANPGISFMVGFFIYLFFVCGEDNSSILCDHVKNLLYF